LVRCGPIEVLFCELNRVQIWVRRVGRCGSTMMGVDRTEERASFRKMSISPMNNRHIIYPAMTKSDAAVFY
jgi:hypothetical protein